MLKHDTYDNLSRLTRLQQQDVALGNVVADKRIDFAYDASGAFTKISRYADQAAAEHVASTHYSYDGLGRLTKLLHTEGPTAPGSGWGTDPLAGYEYVYDAASRFTSINSYVDGLTSFTHDDTDQLTGADHTGQTDETYTYDENGNRTMTGHTVGDNNRLTSDGTYNYTYDDEGNRATKTKISTGEMEEFAWDHRNRMTNVTFKNSGGTITKTVEQSYDVFNQWVRRSVDPDGATGSAGLVDTFFSWEANQINLQFDGPTAADLAHRNLWNPATIDHIFAVEDVASLVAAGVIKWALTDHLGTPRDIASYDTSTNEATVENHRVFDSYGILASETNASFTIAVGFTGVYFDITTGLNYHRNRWYDPLTGQWTAEDPIGFTAGDPNLRRMVGNSVAANRDPTGLEVLTHRAEIESVAGILRDGQFKTPRGFVSFADDRTNNKGMSPKKAAGCVASIIAEVDVSDAIDVSDNYDEFRQLAKHLIAKENPKLSAASSKFKELVTARGGLKSQSQVGGGVFL